jgi:spore coat protein H
MMRNKLLILSFLVAACGGGDDPAATADAGPTGACQPTAGGPFWLEEGEPLAFTVRCATGATATFSIDGLPDGASFDGTAFAWTPGLAQAAVYELPLHADGETATVKIGVADAFDAAGNQPIADPLVYSEEMGLPVVWLATRPVTEEYAPTPIIYRGHTYAAEAKLRGAASLDYPKNSYTLEFTRADKFSDARFGFEDKRKVVLISTFDDNSYVRQRLIYDLWNLLSVDHIQVQTYSAVVYLGGEYAGLYTVADHVNGYLMEDHGLRQDGNLYKAVDHRANFRLSDNDGDAKATPHDGYEKKDGLPVDDFADLDALVTWVDGVSPADFEAGVDARIERRDFEDWWLLVTFALADDSAGKNCYLYHDPLDAESRWRFVPWDFNHSFGQTWQTEREGFDYLEDYAYANELFTKLLAEPSFAGPLRERYEQTLTQLWSKTVLADLVDGYIAEIDASARRDQRRWQDEYEQYPGWSFRSDFTDYEGEVAYLRSWLGSRWDYVDANYWP